MAEHIQAMPQELRVTVNMKLADRQLAKLDGNARLIVRMLVADAYSRGFQDGWIAGQYDARTDAEIERERGDSGASS